MKGKPKGPSSGQGNKEDIQQSENKTSQKPDYPDARYLEKVYPDSELIFKLELLPLAKTKEACLIVLDANVLLAPYRTSPAALDKINSIYTKLKKSKRLFVPAQAAREFAKHRLNKIVELHQATSQHKSKFGNLTLSNLAEFPILKSMTEFQSLQEIDKQITELRSKALKAYDEMLAKIKGWELNDPVSIIYRELFGVDNICNPAIADADLKSDLCRRFDHDIPPGYKDHSKRDGGVGDLLIWHSILDLGKTKNENLIFVTNEGKPDWWHTHGDHQLYPRFELIEEYHRVSNGKSFHLLSLSSFLKLFGVSEDIVQEVKSTEPRHNDTRQSSFRYSNAWIEKSVALWFEREGFSVAFPMPDAGYDFKAVRGATVFTVEVKYVRNVSMASKLISFVSRRLSRGSAQYNRIVFVAASKVHATHLSNMISTEVEFAQHSKVICGFMDNTGNFSEVG